MTKDYENIINQIDWYIFKDNAGSKSEEELNQFMRLVKQSVFDEDFAQFFNKQYDSVEKQQIGEHLLKIECMVEKETIKNYLDGDTSIIDEKLGRCTPDMIEEGKALCVNAQSHVLLVGSGAMPISGMVLHQQFHCKITCLDFDQDALAIAKQWIDQLDAGDAFFYLCNDIFTLTDFKQYSHFLITGHIFGKNRLLQYLLPYLGKQKILLRNSRGLYRYVYDCATHFSGYKMACAVDHGIKMPYISYVLEAYGDLPDVATPYYSFDLTKIKKNYRHMCRLLSQCDHVFYALKANGEKTIVQSMESYKVPFEISSLGELNIVKESAGTDFSIICSLPVKSSDMIKEMYNNHCKYFVFDSWNEFYKLNNFAPDALKILRIKITDISETAIDYGMTEKEFYNIFDPFSMKVDGVTFYNIPNISKKQLSDILKRCSDILAHLRQRPRILNIGGNYRFESDLEPGFYDGLKQILSTLKKDMEDLVVYAEPGRTIVKSAGQIVTKVISVRQQPDVYEIFLDAGIPSGILYPPTRIALLCPAKIPTPHNVTCRFFAVTCSKKLLFEAHMDFLPDENDLLLLEDMGTYSVCKSNHFHGWTLPGIQYR